MIELPTDITNRGEIDAHYVHLACGCYADRIALGYPTGAARAGALAYLRRKTHWPEAFAAGVLDRALESLTR